MGKYVLDRNLGRGLLSTEVGALLLVAGVLSVGSGLVVLHSNRSRRRFLTTVSIGQFMVTLTLQAGLQAIVWSDMEIDLSLRILYLVAILLGCAGAAASWFLYELLPGAVLIGLAAGWNIWQNFSSLVAFDAVNTFGGLMLAGIVSFMTATYRTPMEIMDAGFTGATLLFHGAYAVGLGIVCVIAAETKSMPYPALENYRFYAGISILGFTLLTFCLNAGQHYRAYRIHKENLPHRKSLA
ncbi:hypothetical protein DSO57_1036791 [Entomophthora muscae]|uniref:Uncharacterized protein n=1 Tax=Entomophthora muscae TaxID=34485 RepID=A0ACC2TLK8_9FUNG|nr:hypothetical protein DSO57_1036791 [Entomophthora muscae]